MESPRMIIFACGSCPKSEFVVLEGIFFEKLTHSEIKSIQINKMARIYLIPAICKTVGWIGKCIMPCNKDDINKNILELNF